MTSMVPYTVITTRHYRYVVTVTFTNTIITTMTVTTTGTIAVIAITSITIIAINTDIYAVLVHIMRY